MSRSFRRTLLLVLIGLAIGTGNAAASGGNYVFRGGTPQQRSEVTAALQASTFPWSVVPRQITVNIAPGLASEATPGQIWLDANLLDSGTFSWAIVQHEYAHQVDFLLFSDATRAQLLTVLGGRAWCWGIPGFDHEDYGCERFASTLTWAYWPSADNSLQPDHPGAESAALPVKQFKALLGRLLSAPDPATTGLSAIAAPAQAPTLTARISPAATALRMTSAS